MTAAWDGVPPIPERDGWHWLEWMGYGGNEPTGEPAAYRWEKDGWWDGRMHRTARYWQGWRYLGPDLTPAEVAAALAAAHAAGRIAGMEEAAGIAETKATSGGRIGSWVMSYLRLAASIRAAAKGGTSDD